MTEYLGGRTKKKLFKLKILGCTTCPLAVKRTENLLWVSHALVITDFGVLNESFLYILKLC